MKRWESIRKGFYYGIGLIVPIILMVIGSSILLRYAIPKVQEENVRNANKEYLNELRKDNNNLIELKEYRDVKKGNRIWVYGSIKNISDEKIKSVRVEAEFFDEFNKFVYECNDYIDNVLKPNEEENYLIICGCKDGPFPQYKKAVVEVVSVRKY